MGNAKRGKAGIYFILAIVMLGQLGTSAANYEHNQTAGYIVSGLHVFIDVGLFCILTLLGNDQAKTADRCVLLALSIVVGVFVVGALFQALSTADDKSRNELDKQLIDKTLELASGASNQAALSSTESKNRMVAIKSNPGLQSKYTGQAAEHGKTAAKSTDQAASLLRNAERLAKKKTRREKGLANLTGNTKDAYFVFMSILAALIPSVGWYYSHLFASRIDAENEKLAASQVNLEDNLTSGKPNLTSSTDAACSGLTHEKKESQVSLPQANLGSSEVNLVEVSGVNRDNIIEFKRFSKEAEVIAKKMIKLIGTKDQVKPSKPQIKKHFKGNGGDQTAKEVQEYLIEAGQIEPISIGKGGKPTGYKYTENRMRAV